MGYNAKITSKGQITLPAEMRKVLNLHPGDRVTFSRDPEGRYYVVPETESLGDLRGIVKAGKIKLGRDELERWIDEARGRRGPGLGAARKKRSR